MPTLRSILTAFLLSLVAAPVGAHELWIEPLEARIEPKGRITADLVNGEAFKGLRLPYLPRDIRRLTVHLGDRMAEVTGRIGDSPAIEVPALGQGLHVLAYESVPRTVQYRDFAKFESFAAHKDLGDVAAMTAARGLATGPLTEVYSRFSKALVVVGLGQGADRRLGMETEFVALDPPRSGQPLRLQLHGPDGPRSGVQVELFDRAPGSDVEVSRLRTDAEGIVTLTPVAGHVYMADAVILRVPDATLAAETDATWETLWANLVLRLP